MLCTNCGSDNQLTRRFCRECGHPLSLICSSCGASNDPADNFCGECGKALDGEKPEHTDDAVLDRDPHERRFVAVLFADLVGFTQFSEVRDPEVVRAALTTYFDRARDVITRFGGDVEKFIGDAVMAVWGATVAHEDDAERAVRAGLELTDMVARMGDEMDGGDLSLRVGVLCGEASVAPASPEQGFVVGDLVNTASRLQSIAEPGTVVVGDAAYRMLRDAIEFEPLGEHSLKGKSAAVAIWRAVGVKTDRMQRARSGGLEPAFVGREEELRLLKDALHATERARRARLVSIVGEAGIGKTRLAWELRKYVGGLGGDIYWHDGRSPAYDQGLTFWALGEMVRQRAGIAETDDPLRSRTKLRTAVAEYVPSPTDQEWIEPRLAALLGLDEAPSGERSEFFAAVRSFFQSIAERSTTLLVFEDFHWADAGLIEFVSELVERSPRHPILVLTLARPDLLDRAPGWGAGRRNFTSAHLGPLADDEMAELVTGMVRGIAEDLVAEINIRATGIPLYAVELVRMLIADGDLVMEDDDCCIPTRDLSAIPVPDTVRAVIGARLDRLPPDTRSLLQDAAVLGGAFTGTGLGAMTGLDATQLEELLEPLVHRELLEIESDPRSPARGQYRFVQSMIREVAYGRLTRDERRVRHIRAAEFFAALGELELAGAVAGHYMAAHRVTDAADDAQTLAAEATAALSDAAERAAGLHSHAQALAMIEQALAFPTDSQAEAALWQRASRSAGALAQHETAIGYAYRALDWYREHGDPVDIANGAALVGGELCHAFRAPEAIEVLEPIVTADSTLSEPAVVAAGAGLARAYLMALRDEEAAEMCDRVIGPAERFGLIPTIVDTLITRGTALGNLGRMHEAIALLQGATRDAQDHDLPLAEMRAANNVGHLLAYDDHVGAMDACRTGMEQANRLGEVRFIGSFTGAVAAYLDRDGRFDEGRALRDEVRDRIELPASSLLWYELSDLTARVERGDASAVDPAFDAVRRSVDDANPQSQATVPAARATLNILTTHFEAAYDDVMSVDEAHRSPDHLAIAMIAAAMLGDIERLEVVAEGLKASPARGRMLGAIDSAVSGVLAALRGHTDEAVSGFSRALAFRFLRLDRAHLQALFATLVGREVPEARKASDAAFKVFTETGATAYLDLYAAGMPPTDAQRAVGD
jgi:class 3 adenylate cyclase/tetratricopeptide (TPR) repeat protein